MCGKYILNCKIASFIFLIFIGRSGLMVAIAGILSQDLAAVTPTHIEPVMVLDGGNGRESTPGPGSGDANSLRRRSDCSWCQWPINFAGKKQQ